jgi:hypothetical protein
MNDAYLIMMAAALALFAFAAPMVLVAAMLAKSTWDNQKRIDDLERFADDMSERMRDAESDNTDIWRDQHQAEQDEKDESEAWKGK